MKKTRFSKEKEKEIARQHIDELFSMAENVFSDDPELSNSYMKKARETQMKFRLRMPPEYKRRFCKHCFSYLMPGKTVRIRVSAGKVIYYCLSCKKFMRFPIKK